MKGTQLENSIVSIIRTAAIRNSQLPEHLITFILFNQHMLGEVTRELRLGERGKSRSRFQ